MNAGIKIFYGALALLTTIAICVLAFIAIFSLVKGVPAKNVVAVDFNTILTVLLTTVSVIFTVCAILLAVLGIFGFRNLKREAGRYAEAQAMAEISRAFGPNGKGTKFIEEEMLKKDGKYRAFAEKIIRSQVTSLMPLVIDRINTEPFRMAPGEPTDEGDID